MDLHADIIADIHRQHAARLELIQSPEGRATRGYRPTPTEQAA